MYHWLRVAGGSDAAFALLHLVLLSEKAANARLVSAQ